jgi:hypothetical protein
MIVRNLALALGLFAVLASPARAQDDCVPIPGVTGTIGLDGTIDQFDKVTHRAVVTTADGVRHLLHMTSRTSVHGGAEAAGDPFAELEDGTHVAVHYVETDGRKEAIEIDRIGDDGLSVVDGTVTDIDRGAKKLTLQLTDGKRVTLRLTERATRDVGKDVRTQARVIVYYANENGDLVAHYFTRSR